MDKTMRNKENRNFDFESYYDGIPEDIKSMSLEELEKAIEEEKLKNEQLMHRNKPKRKMKSR